MNDFINQIITPESIGILFGAAGVISLIFEPIKRWLALSSDRVVTLLYTLFIMAGPTLNYFLNDYSSGNPKVVLIQSAVLAFFASPWYRFVVKPLFNKIGEILTERKEQKKAAAAAVLTPSELANEFAVR